MKKIAIINTKWNAEFVWNCTEACLTRLHELWVEESEVSVYTVPWAVEIPLLSKKLLREHDCDAVIAIAVIYRWWIYRHEFVASSVVDQVIRLSSEIGRPIFSSILTPDTDYFESEQNKKFYKEHLKLKGTEVADACIETLKLHDSLTNN